MPAAEIGIISGLYLTFHAVTLALDHDGFGMVQESIEHGTCEGGIIIEDLGPVPKCTV